MVDGEWKNDKGIVLRTYVETRLKNTLVLKHGLGLKSKIGVKSD